MSLQSKKLLHILKCNNNFFSQSGEWQVIENSDPLLQLKRIRQQQQAEIRKLRREGSIARSAYYSSEDEDSSGEGHSSSSDKKDSSVFTSEDQIDGTVLLRKPISPQVVFPSSKEEHIEKSPERKSDRGISENQSTLEDNDEEEDHETSHSEAEQHLDAEQTDDSDTLPRVTKWAEDPGETEEEDSGDEEESASTASLSCLTRVVVGLLETLKEVLRCSSDTTARTLLGEALHMDQTLIMANHPHPVIRKAVLKVSLSEWNRIKAGMANNRMTEGIKGKG